MIQLYGTTEQNMNSVERMLHYTKLPVEGSKMKPRPVAPSWPSRGAIRFENVNFSYRDGLPLVLKGVTFMVQPGEKVGIVGRTGAGKSSLLQALFRCVGQTNILLCFVSDAII
jgi:ATP-binding cassette, subfamily C (CFTR/MRP), member 1